jgi:peptidoglycan-associated lipoprotein
MKRFMVILFMVVFVAVGCSKRTVTQPEKQQAEKQQETAQPRETGQKPEKVTEQKIETVESKDSAEKSAGKEGMFADVLFDYDKYDVRDNYKPVLQAISVWMSKNSDARLSIEGHCDERGTNEYNLALGDRRAKAAKDFLVSLGVASAKIDTLSYGEEKPLCNAQTEECWAKNRRAHFVVLEKAGK